MPSPGPQGAWRPGRVASSPRGLGGHQVLCLGCYWSSGDLGWGEEHIPSLPQSPVSLPHGHPSSRLISFFPVSQPPFLFSFFFPLRLFICLSDSQAGTDTVQDAPLLPPPPAPPLLSLFPSPSLSVFLLSSLPLLRPTVANSGNALRAKPHPSPVFSAHRILSRCAGLSQWPRRARAANPPPACQQPHSRPILPVRPVLASPGLCPLSPSSFPSPRNSVQIQI